MKRYYTPSIEEFHIGFEYQEAWGLENVNEEWIDEVFGLDCTVGGLLPRLRVKWLDREDIESLGFAYDCNRGSGQVFKNNTLTLNFETEASYITIGNEDVEDDSAYHLFQGIVKNKNELKKILKMFSYVPD